MQFSNMLFDIFFDGIDDRVRIGTLLRRCADDGYDLHQKLLVLTSVVFKFSDKRLYLFGINIIYARTVKREKRKKLSRFCQRGRDYLPSIIS